MRFFSVLLLLLWGVYSGIVAQEPPDSIENPCPAHTRNNPPDRAGFQAFIDEFGVSTGLYQAAYPTSPDVKFLGRNTYQVPANTELAIEYAWFRPAGNDRQTLKFLAFLDEQQIPFRRNADDDETVFVPQSEEASEAIESLSLSLPPLSDGIHDLNVVVIRHAESAPAATGSSHTSRLRLSLIAGNTLTSDIAFEPLDADGSRANGHFLMRANLSLSDSTDAWSHPDDYHTIQAGESLSFNVLTGFMSGSYARDLSAPASDVFRFALVFLVDNRQVPYTDSEAVFYGQVAGDTAYTTIPVTLTDFEPGFHEVAVVQMENPRIPVCLLTIEQNISDETVINRVQLKVESD